MKKVWIVFPLLLLAACGNVESSNNHSVSDGGSISEIPVSVTPVSSSTDSESPNSEFTSGSQNSTVAYYNVTGCFKDNKNNPVSNLMLGLFDVNKNEIDKTTTDENGLFSFKELDEGMYYFRVLKSDSDKYKNLDTEWCFEVSGEYYELQLNTIILEIDNTHWSDLM
ncbi:MAG: carboxypeptidase regulatory-like domain-containing protein [Erysipelotrichales bacterium]|nr:carboxypeptidase regulatory-like domain-containing protein [Erysipelotrichales bacterium]